MPGLIKKNNNGGLLAHVADPFLALQHELNKTIGDFHDLFESNVLPSELKAFEKMSLSPAMDLVEDKNQFKLELEMPGIAEEDISISVDDNVLTIEAEKSVSRKNKDKKYVSREIGYGKYERSMVLPQAADADKVTASFKKGMLWVVIPKKAGSKGKAHKVKVKKV